MRKRNLFTGILLLVCFILFSLTSCKTDEAENDVLEEVRSAPVVKLESIEQQDSEPILVDNVGTVASISDMRIQPSTDTFDEEWLYRFTYNPQEKVIDGHEITVLFGLGSMEIDGTTYTPEAGVEYDTILEWAEGVYNYYIEQ